VLLAQAASPLAGAKFCSLLDQQASERSRWQDQSVCSLFGKPLWNEAWTWRDETLILAESSSAESALARNLLEQALTRLPPGPLQIASRVLKLLAPEEARITLLLQAEGGGLHCLSTSTVPLEDFLIDVLRSGLSAYYE